MKVERQLTPARRDAHESDSGKPIMPVPCPMDWRLSGGSPGAATHGLQHEAAFVQENYGTAVAASPFFIRGQSSCRQRFRASSSASRARCSGFWHDQPKSWSIGPM